MFDMRGSSSEREPGREAVDGFGCALRAAQRGPVIEHPDAALWADAPEFGDPRPRSEAAEDQAGYTCQRHIRQHMTTRCDIIMMSAVPFASRADRVRAKSVMGSIMTMRVRVCQNTPCGGVLG
ncbi:hypothetical protein GCM10017586_26520 [Microbacterium imperiale]|uniref:Uncharacterized protein n=1 Tax=Microbacterium imperiale TaxID=33884 RepID=A0A9W6M4J0_9MICO|nr:hypothetical protein GCM10017544_29720 [Microbacterium imperiale]GLJ80969.1 hypothetical protein GCM10017586_26520 [Microbacterium imperiale]